MNSTGGLAGPRGSIRWPLTRRGGFAAPSRLAPARALAQDTPMPRPPLLERDVQFWIRVYTQIDTNAGFLHDQYNLGVVYDTLHFALNTTPAERERQVDQAREGYVAALRRIADAGDAPLSADDQRTKDLWGADITPARLRSAIDDIRFQLAQADRFRAGLIRSGAWETHIAETLANLGLPAELAVLPHVESSFNPAAYSKVGAAGLWQFMRSTGRRYMRIDSAVDDRLDPFRSTEAAAQLLAYNHRVLGTWPLALTAYNHGTAGVRRAKETLGTDDIARIVRSYSSRTFGFASRNFYVSFLAARHRSQSREVLRCAAEADRGPVPGGAGAGLRAHGDPRARSEDRRRQAARAEPGAAALGVGRPAARAQGLSPAAAPRRLGLDPPAARAASESRRDVRRPEQPAALPGATRRHAHQRGGALRRLRRDARPAEPPAHRCAAARRPQHHRARDGAGHGRRGRGARSRSPRAGRGQPARGARSRSPRAGRGQPARR